MKYEVRDHRWILFTIDLSIVFLAGLLSFAFYHGVSGLLLGFGSICLTLCEFLVFYSIGFIIWHTYDSFNRSYSNWDFLYTIGGVITGGVLCSVCMYCGLSGTVFSSHDLILQMIFSIIGIRAVRHLILIHYQFYGRRSENNGYYGLSDIALLNVELSEFLPRSPIHIDIENINREISGKVVLVTGGAGSIGSALVKKIATYNPSLLIIVDQAETPLHQLGIELRRDFPSLSFKSVLTDVANATVMQHVFECHRPSVVFHAAAYKHVSMMEENPVECVLNNVRSTVMLVDMAVDSNCRKFVLVSSDKAVNPSGLMGCSKRICEIYCQSFNYSDKNNGCAFITTRFGNVLGSSGSVVPIFRDQIRRGGPLTLTHPDVIRYFMLVEEACDLVLEASVLGVGGEIFVFDMGKPVKILDLARKMIQISGRKDIKIEYIGLGVGEKLFEEILADKEHITSTVNEKIWIAKVTAPDFEIVSEKIKKLILAAENNDAVSVKTLMHEIVPEFAERNNR